MYPLMIAGKAPPGASTGRSHSHFGAGDNAKKNMNAHGIDRLDFIVFDKIYYH